MHPDIKKLTTLRKRLHKTPELSGKEKETPAMIREFLEPLQPDRIIESLGGNGMAVLYQGKAPGPTVLFRCELDALPIEEVNGFAHRSTRYGASHKCGHDGHMAILAGLASVLHDTPPAKGRAVLLFQPAEETGAGALQVLKDEKFDSILPDYVFALHNLPGVPMHQVVLKDGVFAAASVGLKIQLKGKTSHASEPEKGTNPAFVVASILNSIKRYALPGINPERIKLITPVHCRLGEEAFGTSPGEANLMLTLRASHSKDMDLLKNFTQRAIQKALQKIPPLNALHVEQEWVEAFPNTVNTPQCNEMVRKAASSAGLETQDILFPFRWSEDFGHFLDRYPGALFGLGSGTDTPALHNPDYDFPDELIGSGTRVFYNIAKSLLY